MYKNGWKKTDKYHATFWVLLLIVVLCSYMLVGSVLAWLKIDYTHEDDRTDLGVVGLELYVNGVKVSGDTPNVNGVNTITIGTPYALATTGTNKTVNIKIRNSGTIDALVRATVRVYFIDSNNNQSTVLTSVTPATFGTTLAVALNHTGWTNALVSGVAQGHLFYNNKLSPYIVNGSAVPANEISIISQVVVPSDRATLPLFVTVTADACAYAGNIYKKIENGETTPADIPVQAYPFGSKETLPSTWSIWR